MAVRLRLRRMGKKKKPFYRIVAIDSKVARNGRYIEKIGIYNPLTEPADIKINEDRALYWLQQGATTSDTIRSFLRKKGVLFKWNLIKMGADEAKIAEEVSKWQVLQLEKQKRRDALAEQKKRETKEKSPEPESSEIKDEKVEESAQIIAETKDKDEEVNAVEATEEPITEAKAVEKTSKTEESTPDVVGEKQEDATTKEEETKKTK